MEKTNKKIITGFALMFVVGLALGLIVNVVIVHRNPNVRVSIAISENHGGIDSEVYAGNVITDIGELWARNLMGFANDSLSAWSISVSNDASPVQTWTQLPNEVNANGFTRYSGTVTAWLNGADYAFNVTYQFTATGAQQLQCAGLQWSSTAVSNNNLFACAAFTQTTFGSSDTLSITWSITVDAN